MALPFPSLRVWPVPVTGGALCLLGAKQLGADGGGAVFAAVVGAGLAYLLWCGLFPRVRCWVCRGNPVITDGMGGERERPCLRCNRNRRIRRPGAQFIGAVGRRE